MESPEAEKKKQWYSIQEAAEYLDVAEPTLYRWMRVGDFPKKHSFRGRKVGVCGAAAALCWALGFVAARQGVTAGMSPLVIALHRFVWPGPDLRPVTRGDPKRFHYGPLPPSLFRQIRDRLLASAAVQRLQIVARSE